MITKSAQKAYRQNIKRRGNNAKQKLALKKIIKEFQKLVGAKKIKEAQEKLSKVYKALDKAAKNKIIERNKAARLKSRLTKKISIKK